MTSNPYTPDEVELIGCYAGAMEEHAGENYATAKADAERGIAKVRADAWDEGLQAGWEECRNPDPFVNDWWDSKAPNPHRIESGASNE